MVQILPQRDIGGDIGKAFGSALSEQLGEKFKARRLSNAFKEYQQGISEGNPDVSKLIRTPGAMEALPALTPYIKQQAELAAARKRAEREKQPSFTISTQGGIPGATNVEEFGNVIPESEGKRFLSTKEITELNKKIPTAPNTKDINALANQLREDNPLLTNAEAKAQAREEITTNKESLRENINQTVSLADEGVAQILASKGLKDAKSLEGQILEKIKEQLKADVIRGASPEEAWNSIKGSISDMAAGLVNLQGGSKWGSKAESNIKSVYKKFDDLGLGDRFPLYVAEIFDIPVMTASQIVEPVKNKEFLNEAKFFKFGKDYNKMAQSITDKDNIASMMDYLNDKGLSLEKFRQAALQDKVYNRLTDFQKTQLLQELPTPTDVLNKEFFKVIGRGG